MCVYTYMYIYIYIYVSHIYIYIYIHIHIIYRDFAGAPYLGAPHYKLICPYRFTPA